LYYIFPEDLSDALSVFDGFLSLDAASLETTVLVE
jgi:hypothetical protein